ncbi:MAG: bifunctional UDP-N-acetylglucosamine diphosphorylase/glucosamine-1-phosphate N-acetyltransferase GlmU [Pseudomonadota bacterium]
MIANNALEVVVLAAGKGTRMRSALPKVLHDLAGRTMLGHVLHTAAALQPQAVHVVVGHGADVVRERFGDTNVNWVVQEQQLGTGHAVAQALPAVAEAAHVLVLYGDVPLTPVTLLQQCFAAAQAGPALITARMPDPAQLGRIVRSAAGDVERIVEYKDASDAERAIDEINSGILCASADFLRDHLNRLDSDNAQGEYYLTDVIGSAVADGLPVTAVVAEEPLDVAGVNDRVQLAELEREYQARAAVELMRGGATLRDPARIDVRGTVRTGSDCLIDINAVFEGDVVLGNDVTIGPNCVLVDAEIGSGTVVHANTVVEGAHIGERCSIGPFARIRPGSEFAEGVKVGNFVETKKSRLAAGAKANHLAYLGDATIGESVNIGAGTITCNYDGINKHRTEIGDDVFVGTNATLVAPLSLGDGAFVAAGSTVTTRVGDGSLAVGRARQRNIDGWTRPDKRAPTDTDESSRNGS